MHKGPLVSRFAISTVLLLGLLFSHSAFAAAGSQRANETGSMGPVPKAQCGPSNRTESGLQGQTTSQERASGDSQRGYNCNLELVGQNDLRDAGHADNVPAQIPEHIDFRRRLKTRSFRTDISPRLVQFNAFFHGGRQQQPPQRPILGAVVDHDHLEVGVAQPEHRAHGPADRLLLVEGRHDDGDPRQGAGGRRHLGQGALRGQALATDLEPRQQDHEQVDQVEDRDEDSGCDGRSRGRQSEQCHGPKNSMTIRSLGVSAEPPP